ncbi:MAG: hypothetical protein M3Q95_09625 [Bacteroidota bacterium]|nr:hypothetical protein [Bacteroidota bacterium]
MNYFFSDIPQFIPAATYHEAIARMVKRLLDSGKVKGVYQVGGITSPGISDIDLYVVFHDNEPFEINPVKELDFPDNYLFTHRLFGTCEKNAVQLEQFTFFGKYNFLGGNPTPLVNYTANETDTLVLKHQVALEYLVKAWYSNAIGMTYGIVKLRNLLLHAKAILLDLDFLGLKETDLVKCIHEIMEVRKSWFDKPAGKAILTALVKRYDTGLREAISQATAAYGFFVPEHANFRLSKRVYLAPSRELRLNREGFLFPAPATRYSKKIYKIQDKMNRFTVEVPVSNQHIPTVLLNRHNVMQEAFKYNSQYLPGFLCTGHAMNIFNSEHHDG